MKAFKHIFLLFVINGVLAWGAREISLELNHRPEKAAVLEQAISDTSVPDDVLWSLLEGNAEDLQKYLREQPGESVIYLWGLDTTGGFSRYDTIGVIREENPKNVMYIGNEHIPPDADIHFPEDLGEIYFGVYSTIYEVNPDDYIDIFRGLEYVDASRVEEATEATCTDSVSRSKDTVEQDSRVTLEDDRGPFAGKTIEGFCSR